MHNPLPPHVRAAHDEADARRAPGYIDPDTGLFVMTTGHLTRRGYCCGNGCRHCPYPEVEAGADPSGSRS